MGSFASVLAFWDGKGIRSNTSIGSREGHKLACSPSRTQGKHTAIPILLAWTEFRDSWVGHPLGLGDVQGMASCIGSRGAQDAPRRSEAIRIRPAVRLIMVPSKQSREARGNYVLHFRSTLPPATPMATSLHFVMPTGCC